MLPLEIKNTSKSVEYGIGFIETFRRKQYYYSNSVINNWKLSVILRTLENAAKKVVPTFRLMGIIDPTEKYQFNVLGF